MSKKEKNRDKAIQYAARIVNALGELFSDGEHEMDMEELMEGDNLTNFIHGLANIAPTMIYNELTGEERENLEFNHIANRLCFQYSTSIKNEENE